MTISRRTFLQVGTASLAAVGLAPWFRSLTGTGVSYATGLTNKIVVFVQMFGGCDGINMVYPFSGGTHPFS